MGLTAAAASVIQGGLNLLGGLGSSGMTAGYNAKEAQKDRDFQKSMYEQQVQDNIKFWNMQNKYNLPSAQLQRIQDAGLNPLLMYGGSGLSGNLASQAPQPAQAPHGSTARAQFQNPMEFANLELVNAQADALHAEAEQKRQEVQESQSRANLNAQDLLFKRLTMQVDIALKHGSLSQIFAATDNLREQTYATGQMTLQSTLSMMQARQYEIKRFNLDEATIGEQLQQRWKEIANGTIAANAQMKSAMAATMSAAATWNLSNAQVGQIALNMSQQKSMFPLLMENQRNVNWSQVQDRIFKGVQITNEQKRGFMQEIENRLELSGAGKGTMLYKWAAPWIVPAIRDNYDSKSIQNYYGK